MIEQILPAGVAGADAFGDPVEARLSVDEEFLVRHAVHKRRLEFTTVRFCARSALTRLGGPAVPILPDSHGAPRWPPGFVGSMTHCSGYRAAAVGRATEFSAIGVDAEPNEPLPRGLAAQVARPAELRRCDERCRDSAAFPDRLLFCAKEAIYKAWYPLTTRWLDFTDVAVSVSEPGLGVFCGRLLGPAPLVVGREWHRFDGRWVVADGLIVTAVVVPALEGWPTGSAT